MLNCAKKLMAKLYLQEKSRKEFLVENGNISMEMEKFNVSKFTLKELDLFV
jgi:hypothetical protein